MEIMFYWRIPTLIKLIQRSKSVTLTNVKRDMVLQSIIRFDLGRMVGEVFHEVFQLMIEMSSRE